MTAGTLSFGEFLLLYTANSLVNIPYWERGRFVQAMAAQAESRAKSRLDARSTESFREIELARNAILTWTVIFSAVIYQG